MRITLLRAPIDGLRDALGTGSTITLTVDAVPDSLTLAEVVGVSDVAVDDRTIPTIWLTIARKEFADALRSRMSGGIVVI